MAYYAIGGFPPQQLPFRKKTKEWRRKCVQFGDNHSLLHYNVAVKSVNAMQINYDLLEGKLHMEDLKMLLNPYDLNASFIPDNVQHYSIMNSKLNVLRGEESERYFDFRAVITNPTAISEMEREKNELANQRLQQILMDTSQSEEEYMQELEKLSDYLSYEYQDKREVRANRVLNHYMKEQDFPQLWNKGFVDVEAVAEEIYQCDIVGGEPVLEKLDPRKVRIIGLGNESEIEKADIIVIEDYWSLGKTIDTFWDQLTAKDIKKLESSSDNSENTFTDSLSNLDPRYGFALNLSEDWVAGDQQINPYELFSNDLHTTLTPFDVNGNVRVMKVYWKSRRQIKKVKSFDPVTGEEQFDFYPETYHCDPMKGEEEQIFWINEAWEGTKIGKDIYVNMRPRPIQYNRLSNPSRCHFGIIGSIYNMNGDKPYSLVDMAKPYAYLYDVIHDRLNKTLAKNHGKVIRMDFAKVPKGWDPDRWLYFITVNGVAVENSFNEGNIGAATGKLAGGMNNATTGVIDASLSNEIQQYISLLEWIANKIGEILGISRQREGQISNRETVGGVERATLQSSHITKSVFFIHESVKRRCLECFLETFKIAYKGRKVKFDYVTASGVKESIEFDGDEFAECDYGIVMDNSNGAQELNQKLDMLAQAALQNQLLDFSTIMKIYTTVSLSEKQRIVENTEKRIMEQKQKEQEQTMQLQQQKMQEDAAIAQQKMEMEYKMHQEKLETQVLVAQINASAEWDRYAMIQEENGITKQQELEYKQKQLELSDKQFNAKLKESSRQFENKLALDRQKQREDVRIKEKQIAKSNTKK